MIVLRVRKNGSKEEGNKQRGPALHGIVCFTLPQVSIMDP